MRRFAAVLVILGALVLGALLLGRASGPQPSAAKASGVAAHAALHERSQEAEAGADAEAYADRAYPSADVSIDNIQGAIAANSAVAARGSRLNSKWDALGPDTLNVDRLGTQSFIKATQWSGRVAALAVDPKCKPQECTLYVGSAGGGLWRSKNPLAPTPAWKQISGGIPSNAIGAVAIDPNDETGRTVYAGTGEANNSSSSVAGLGLYKTTDDGAHWSLVPGSAAVAANRGIAWIAIERGNADHILIGTRPATRGYGSNSTTSQAIPGAPATGVYDSHDGGATFTLTQAGAINEVKFDPSNANVVYAAQAGVGLIRSNTGGTAGSWETIFAANRGRFSFSPVRLPNGKTRIYLADANVPGTPAGAEVFRVDDASQPAATLTAGGNAAWTRLSNPVNHTPGFAAYQFCFSPLSGSQCVYDMFILSPPERPDMVVLGGLMHYEELKPYAAPGGMRGNGRSVLMSLDAGATWTDMTNDVGGEAMHPDQHAIAFVPGNPDQFFVGSDGGVIRTNGKWADASSQCDSRGLSAADLADCHAWLSRIPAELQVVNAGLGTLQLNSIAVSPYQDDLALAGTQDNGTLVFSGSPTWFLPLTGDGGDAGYDAADPNLHMHTYFVGQMDVNYHGDDPTSWLWIGDRFIVNFPEAIRFYTPTIDDPLVSKTIFVGAQRVWRTQNAGGDRAFLEAHCNTAVGEFPSDLLFTGACGSDWSPLGSATLTGNGFGNTKSGNTLSAVTRGNDGGTLWAGSGAGRVLVSKNANDSAASVTFARVDTPAQPTRVVSSIFVDPANANHAWVTFSGFEANTPATPGHVFDVMYDPAAGTATWTNISTDLGDQPINDLVLDSATGDLFVSSDFAVYRRVSGTTTWIQAADGLPTVTVPGLTIATAKQTGDRLLYAATHGRGAYRLRLK